MNHTFSSYVKQQLESIGYSFMKCENNYWNFIEDGAIIDSNRHLGGLLRSLAKEFNIEWEN